MFGDPGWRTRKSFLVTAAVPRANIYVLDRALAIIFTVPWCRHGLSPNYVIRWNVTRTDLYFCFRMRNTGSGESFHLPVNCSIC